MALASYYWRHICSFAEIVRPLHDLTKKSIHLHWGSRQQKALKAPKNALVNAPVLAMPIDGGGYVLDTDGCNHSVGYMLQKMQGDELSHLLRKQSFLQKEL